MQCEQVGTVCFGCVAIDQTFDGGSTLVQVYVCYFLGEIFHLPCWWPTWLCSLLYALPVLVQYIDQLLATQECNQQGDNGNNVITGGSLH